MLRYRVNEVIETAPQVIDAVADDQGPPEQIGVGSGSFGDDRVTREIGVMLKGESVAATLHPCDDLSVDHLVMLLSAA